MALRDSQRALLSGQSLGKGHYLSTHLQLDDLDLVSDDRRFVTLVQGCIEHLDCICMKLV